MDQALVQQPESSIPSPGKNKWNQPFLRRMTSRVKIPTGQKCNAKCRFCYYWDSLRCENPPTHVIEAKLRYARSKGILDVDFSGGEPSIRSDLPRLVSYAKALGFREICVITNGIKLSNAKELRKLVNAGLTDLLCSVEGDTATLHEHLVQVLGSFNKVIRTIQNGLDAGIRVRTNTTVTIHNYKQTHTVAALLKKLQPDAINFIMFNAWCSAGDLARDLTCRYSDAAPYLKNAIKEARENVSKVTVRYMPFCFMRGYEAYVCNLLQKKYDTDEWDDAVKMALLEAVDCDNIEANKVAVWCRDILQFSSFADMWRLRTRAYYHDLEIERMCEDYHFSTRCACCRYFSICDGVSSAYRNVFGLGELRPVNSNTIKDPSFINCRRQE